jgi:hypothetical protein
VVIESFQMRFNGYISSNLIPFLFKKKKNKKKNSEIKILIKFESLRCDLDNAASKACSTGFLSHL